MILTARVRVWPSSTLALAASIGVLALCPTLGTGIKPPVASVMAAGASAPVSALKKAAQSFVENRGQWDAQAQFLARSPGVDIWITEGGVVYDFHQARVRGSGSWVEGLQPSEESIDKISKHQTPNTQHPAKRRGHVVRMEFVGGTPSSVRGEGLLEGRYNYFLGKDESKWASNVPRYGEARAERVYDGIEARWYFDQGMPRYDLIVAPSADPDRIAMRFDGAQGMAGGKTLKLGTSLGDVEHKGLFAYQKVGDAAKQVQASFVVRGNVARFELGDYDKSKPLVIDPLIYSTYLGTSGSDIAKAVVAHSSGDAIVAGQTDSASFPTTTGAYEQTFGGVSDAFVSRLSANGESLLYSTFLGGSATDDLAAIAVSDAGGAALVGRTSSSDFPTTDGAFDTSHNASVDVFVTKLSPDGSFLVFSTYFGGTAIDLAGSVALDSSGRTTVVGRTSSTDFPTKAGSYDQTFNGDSDAYAMRLSADGSTLIYSTFLGGAQADSAQDVALDSGGRAFIVGYTSSPGFPTTLGAFDVTHSFFADVFVLRLSADGSSLLYSTLIGDNDADYGQSIALDSTGAAIVVGTTWSTSFPTTGGAYDTTHNGEGDAFVAKLLANGSSLNFSTFLGRVADDYSQSVVLDSSGNVVVAGHTYSAGFPTTAGAYDQTHNGVSDAFVSRLSANGSSLLYSTLLGGSNEEQTQSISMDSMGNAAVVGLTQSSDYPTTSGAYDRTHNGSTDAFVTKLPVSPVVSGVSVPRSSFVGGFSVPLTIQTSVVSSLDYAVNLSTDTPGKVFVEQTKIKAGKDSKTLGVRTETVKVDTLVKVTASFGGVSKSVSFTLKPGGLMSLKLKPTAISSLQLGTGTVALSSPAPIDGRRIELDSSNNSVLFVPVAVDIEHGQTEAVFPTFAGFIASTSTVTVKARLGTMVKTATLTVSP